MNAWVRQRNESAMYRFYFPAKVPGRPWPLAVLATCLLMILSTSGPARADGDAAAGANVFNRCAACHQTGPGASNGVGPQLSGVIGRPIASVPGYDYSSGLAAFGGQVWSRDRWRSTSPIPPASSASAAQCRRSACGRSRWLTC
jgi:hypothetical protein